MEEDQEEDLIFPIHIPFQTSQHRISQDSPPSRLPNYLSQQPVPLDLPRPRVPLDLPQPRVPQYTSSRRQERPEDSGGIVQSVSNDGSTEHPLAPQFQNPLPPKYLKPILPRKKEKALKSSISKKSLFHDEQPVSPQLPSLQGLPGTTHKLQDTSSTGDSGKSTLSDDSSEAVNIPPVRKKTTRANVTFETKKNALQDDTASLRKHLMKKYKSRGDDPASIYSYLSANIDYIPVRICSLTPQKTEDDLFNSANTETKLESPEGVFREKDTEFKRIFIQGDAGCGKSTFLQKIVRDWIQAHEKAEKQGKGTLNSYELVLLRFLILIAIPLDKICDEKRMEDVLSKYVLGKDCPVNTKDCINMLKEHTANVLFLLDGFDEYSDASSVVDEMLRGTAFTEATVILSSQSWKLNMPTVSGTCDRLFEIKGFDNDNSKAFISQFMLSKKFGETEVDRIVTEIWNRMALFENISMKNNPMLLLFICITWLENSAVPCKPSEIYEEMIQCLNTMFDKENSQEKLKVQEDITNDENKPKPTFQGLLVNTGKIAFRCLLSRKQCPIRVPSHWFDQPMYQDYLVLAVELGLIQETKIIQKQKNVPVAAFVCKSVAEFLAAYYLCNVNDTSIVFHEQATIIELINNGKIDKSFVYKFLDILIFASGINPFITCELLTILLPEMESDYIVMHKLTKCAQELTLIDGLVLPFKCLLFNRNISETLIKLCRSSLEYLYFTSCELKEIQNKLDGQVNRGQANIKLSQPLFTSQENLQNLKFLRLSHVNLCDVSLLEMTLPKLEELTLCAISPNCKALMEILTKVKSSVLQEITIEHCDLMNEVVSFPNIESLCTLNLGNLKMRSDCWKSLLQSLENFPHLNSLAVSKSTISGERILFSTNLKTLTKLELNTLEFESDKHRADFFLSISNLSGLEMIVITSMAVKKVITHLETLPKLKQMVLNEIVFESTVSFSRSTLSVLELNRLTFNDHCGQNFITSMIKLTNLTKLSISFCRFQKENINFLKLKSLKEVSLVRNKMTSNCWCVSIFSLGQLENLATLEVVYAKDEDTNVGALIEDMVDQRSPVPKIVSFAKSGKENSITVDFTNKESLMKTGSCCTQ